MTADPSPASDEPVVLSERHDGVLLLTLNRPARLNAWTRELEDRYYELLAGADRDPEVRAIVITGAGRGFCAGGDMDELRDEATSGAHYESGGAGMAFPLSVRKPLIAAINGACAGLGLVQALYCDVRFAASDAKLTTSFARRGLVAEYGIAWLLPRLVGAGRARDLLLSGRVISGEEAGEMGLVEFVTPRLTIVDDALRYAREIATHCSPSAVAEIKQQLHQAAAVDFAAGYDEADAAMARTFALPDFAEGVASFIERRPPRFPPLS
jgi:enoyl-CoA hydratase/carnithine racemase